MATLGNSKLSTSLGPTISFACKQWSATSRASTTSLADDPDLQCPLTAGTWVMSGLVIYTPGSTGDINLGFTAPPGGSSHWVVLGVDSAATAAVATLDVATNTNEGPKRLGGGTGSHAALLSGLFVCGGSVTIALRWAQANSNTTAAIVRQGSWLRFEQVA